LIFNTNYKQETTHKLYAYICLAAVSILWGTTWIASTYSVRQGTPAFQVVMLRQFLAGLVMLVVMIIIKKGQIKWPPIKNTIYLSFLNFICSNGVSTWAVQYLPGGLASIIGATYPLWLVLIYYFFYNRVVNYKVWIGLFTCFIGLVIIFLPKISFDQFDNKYFLGLGLSIFATMTWAVANIVTKQQTEKDIDPYISLSLQMILSSVVIYLVLKSFGIWMPLSSIKGEVWLGIWYLVIIGSVIAYSCFLYALKHLDAEQVSIYAYVNPIVALLLGFFFLNEEINSYTATGTIIVLGGLYLLNKTFNAN
jgi:drug/metabolite transporter (DMT)-like permease